MNFLEEWFEDPIKLWGSAFVVMAILFSVFSKDSAIATSEPFSEDSSFVSQEQVAQADEEVFDEGDSFVSEEDIEDDTTDNSFVSEEEFDSNPFTYKQAVLNPDTGDIVEKEFDMNGNEIKKENPDSKTKIEELEKRVNQLEKKVNEDPFN